MLCWLLLQVCFNFIASRLAWHLWVRSFPLTPQANAQSLSTSWPQQFPRSLSRFHRSCSHDDCTYFVVDCDIVRFGRWLLMFLVSHILFLLARIRFFSPHLIINLIGHLPVSPNHILDPENGGSLFSQNVGICLQYCVLLQPRLLPFAQTSYWVNPVMDSGNLRP